MPPKVYLVGWRYVRERLSAGVGYPVHRSSVYTVMEARGFPREYYTPEQKADLHLIDRLYDRRLVDAYLDRVLDGRIQLRLRRA